MHIPVLQKEVLKYLDPKPNENFIDCTVGDGGHGLAILEAIEPNGKLLGMDCDKGQISNFKSKIENLKELKKERAILVCDNFVNLEKIVEKQNFQPVSGILFDLGMSSWHLEESGRGFSFRKEEPLDMRYNQNSKLTAKEILNNRTKSEIENILKEYGEERFAERIAENITEARKIRPIKTTFQLVEIIKRATPSWYRRKKIHPATKTFQSLRIAVNNELENIKKTLPQALEILKPGGRLAIISFHSMEDRIVKNFFRQKENFLKILTKKPITASIEEIKINPRARSAKLRAAIK